MKDKNRRLIHVYTGPGKGKTTAAFGLALRACGHGWKVLIIQFLKGSQEYGEVQSSKNLQNLSIEQYGGSTFIKKGKISDVDKKIALEGFERAQKAVIQSQFDLIILDEIHVAVDFGLIPLEELVSLIQRKPDNVELVLTGRNAHSDVIQMVDLVSYIDEVKHPFQEGMSAREGIEF